jgi:hypothetical protein
VDSITLYRAIAPVCPIVDTSVGEPEVRSTWAFTPTPAATQPQKDAAQNVIDTIDTTVLPTIKPADFIRRFTDAEYLALKQKHDADLAANDVTGIKVWDMVIGSVTLNPNSADAQTLKADMVTDGILTQARADEIFSGGGVTLASGFMS